MTQKGKYFTRIFKHYMIQALSYSGGQIDRDVHTELDEACENLLEALNPKVTTAKAEEPKEPFAYDRDPFGGQYRIYHQETNKVVGYWTLKGQAKRRCKWINELVNI